MGDWGFLLWVLSVTPMAYSYAVYPFLLQQWYKAFRPKPDGIGDSHFEPGVSVLMSVYNEALVLPEKLKKLDEQDFGSGQLHVFIGSDASTDETNEILRRWAAGHSNRHVLLSDQRTGKPGMIDRLTKMAYQQNGKTPDHIFILTDASVMPEPDTISRLVGHFSHPGIGLVDAHLVHTGMQKEGISRSENTYITTEVKTKYLEGVLWQKMMGPFGGFFALRANLYEPVPSNFLVDDFFLCMQVLRKGSGAISDLEAVCTEAVSHELKEEFRRKERISAGNFQNMFYFSDLWWPPTTRLSFVLLSHKILRWLGPFWLGGILTGTILMGAGGNNFYTGLFCIGLFVFLGIPFLHRSLRYFGRHFKLFSDIDYFLWMHLALLKGFLKYLYGIKSNVWKPTRRDQHPAQ
jgi:cellulose synthase/poly-beta-1,6-N-acetylglucosamine synthase-like glycosyltransferase